MSYVDERRGEYSDTNPQPLQLRSFKLPFNGTLSADEMRMLNQGIGHAGTNYDDLLREWDVEEVLE